MFHRFEFEAEFYPTLERIPFHVRMKLDVTGVKLSLGTWRAFTVEERWVLCHLPVETEEERGVFVGYLAWLSRTRAGAETEAGPVLAAALWSKEVFPAAVRQRNDANGRTLTVEDWRRLAEHERYALYKTAMSRDPNLYNAALGELRGRLAARV